ncbi:MAG: START domain-containing protein [Cyclobacteriaceae bacterium]|nr:START domain-containing protein [Cyclobacteriaceae bacterium]
MIILIFHFTSTNNVYGQENCEQKKNEEGIQVYLCETSGSPFKTVSVNFTAKTTLKQYAAGVLDIANITKWQTNIINQYVLKTINEKELIYYCEVDAPWPIAHRDLIFRFKMSQDSTTKVLTVTLKQLPEYIPVKKDIVRVPKAESILTVTPLSESKVKVNYTIHVDPGGEVPAFIVNLFAVQGPWQTYKNYRDLLSTGAISDSEIDFIENY